MQLSLQMAAAFSKKQFCINLNARHTSIKLPADEINEKKLCSTAPNTGRCNP
jgi:hypothetical protein